MRLTLFSDYTLRVLMYLGVHRDGLSTIHQIAEAYGISKNHLMKVVHYLAQNGYLETVRGKGGGIRLARAPAEINLGQVVRQTERDTVLVECFGGEPSCCRIVSACDLKFILQQAAEAFYGHLDRFTLQDLLGREREMKPLLGLIATSAG